MMSQWRDVPGYEGRLRVSCDGQVRRKHRFGWSAAFFPRPDAHGYAHVRPRRQGTDVVRKNITVHRAVWMAFVGPIPPDMTIDHIDRCRSNNNLKNLRLATGEEQRANTVVTKPRRDARGLLVWRLSRPDDVMFFRHGREAERVLGANQRALRSVASGKARRTGEFSCKWAESDAFLEGEMFRTLTLNKGTVAVSNFGRLLDGKSKAFAVVPVATAGNVYPTVGTGSVTMHRAMANAWPELIGGEPGNDKTIDHIDRNVNNNHPSNLRWATAKEQAANRSDHRLSSETFPCTQPSPLFVPPAH